MSVCRHCNIQAYATYEHKDGADYWDVHFEHPKANGDSPAGFFGCLVLALALLALVYYLAQLTG